MNTSLVRPLARHDMLAFCTFNLLGWTFDGGVKTLFFLFFTSKKLGSPVLNTTCTFFVLQRLQRVLNVIISPTHPNKCLVILSVLK